MKNMQWKKQVEQNFGGAAKNYDAYAEVQCESAKELMKLCPDGASDILEIGCGTGTLTKMLCDSYSDARILATDISADMIEHARKNTPMENIEWHVMDGENVQLDQNFDLIISNMVFQWFEDRSASIEKLKSHLKPGGQILYALPGIDTFTEWRNTLRELNIPCGTLKFDKPSNIIKETHLQINYGNAYNFLKSLKEIGAHNPHPEYETIGASLRKACARFDQLHQGHISWHIVYVRET